jgi:uncharacterized protein YegL
MKKINDITIILDRSGSMESIKEVTIRGFNSFLEKQRKSKFGSSLTFVQFDDEYEIVYESKPINKVKDLTNKNFIPRGTTSLLDAIGNTIVLTKERLNQESTTENVLIAIVTDGFENSSIKYTRNKIFKMIRSMEQERNWNFVFLGANQDAIQEGAKLGISFDRALTFNSNERGVENAFSSLAENTFDLSNNLNSKFSFSIEDRNKQNKE